MLSVAEQINLPPGFRFHPTDEELVNFYLIRKVADSGFNALAIAEVDLKRFEAWELPWKSKMGESEWYFFSLRDKKYPTGLRTNRATAGGYWKATGKDREVYKEKTLVGMKKTLVFYIGRAPRGDKTNWIMHEYRLEGEETLRNLPETANLDWDHFRVFQKCPAPGGGKIPVPGLAGMDYYVNLMSQTNLPSLTDSYSSHAEINPNLPAQPVNESLSNPIRFPMNQSNTNGVAYYKNGSSSSTVLMNFPPLSPNNCPPPNLRQFPGRFQTLTQQQEFLKSLMETQASTVMHFNSDKQIIKGSQELADTSSGMPSSDIDIDIENMIEDPDQSSSAIDMDDILED